MSCEANSESKSNKRENAIYHICLRWSPHNQEDKKVGGLAYAYHNLPHINLTVCVRSFCVGI